MALSITATGTVQELCELWDVMNVCDMLGIDYYKVSQIPDGTTFTITEKELKAVKLLEE